MEFLRAIRDRKRRLVAKAAVVVPATPKLLQRRLFPMPAELFQRLVAKGAEVVAVLEAAEVPVLPVVELVAGQVAEKLPIVAEQAEAVAEAEHPQLRQLKRWKKRLS